MSYQVLARKWRPQRFDEVVGQGGVTSTLKNAIAQRPPRAGVRVRRPARRRQDDDRAHPRPGAELREGADRRPVRRVRRLRRDCRRPRHGRARDRRGHAHTGIDNVRDVIISGLAIPPARDRYKIFIIDEVHQLSRRSFNALLKSIEEPPPHVVFIMATTELDKIPETIISRVAGLRVPDDLRARRSRSSSAKIAAAEGIDGRRRGPRA